MGTGAAQIAAAGRHPDALRKIDLLMREILDRSGADKPIAWQNRNRLYELAYGLAFGGDEALNHISPLEEFDEPEGRELGTTFRDGPAFTQAYVWSAGNNTKHGNR